MQYNCSIKFQNLNRLFSIFAFSLPIILSLQFSSRVLAEEELDIYLMSIEELMEMTVTSATKSEQPWSATPGRVTLITRQQIQASGARTLPDLLRGVAGVNVRWNPMAETIDIRGFGENPLTNRVLLLIDGVPYNSQSEGGFPQHIGFDFFNLKNIKQVEVIVGGGSALYGENAYWGIINIESLSGGDLEGTRVSLESGDRDTFSTSLLMGDKFEDGEWLISAEMLQTQLPHAFWYAENDSSYEGQNLFLKLDYKGSTFSYYRHVAENEGFRLDASSIVPDSVFASAELIEETVDIFSLKTEQSVAQDTMLKASLSYVQRKGTQCSACHAANQYADSSSVGKHGQQLIGDIHLIHSGFEKNEFTIGIERREVDAGEDRTELIDPDSTGPEPVLDYVKYAFYIQDQISLLDDKLNLLIGGRYDGETDPDLFEKNFSPRFAAVYQLSEKTTVKGSMSRSFHFPDFSTMYLHTWYQNIENSLGATGLIEFVPNHDLKPEEIVNFDLGATMLVTDSLSVSTSLYQSILDDFIVMSFRNYAGVIDEVTFENHTGEAVVRGFEAEINYKSNDQFIWHLNFAYQHNHQRGDDVDSSIVVDQNGQLVTGLPIEFSYAPNRKLNAGVSFNDIYNFSGTFEVHWKDDYLVPTTWAFIAGDNRLESYTLAHLRISYPFRNLLSKDDQLMLTAKWRNLLDETPIETLIGTNNKIVGREFFFGAEYEWKFK